MSKALLLSRVGIIANVKLHFCNFLLRGLVYVVNLLILPNFDPNFVVHEISVN